jgi:hypothetical protein
MRKKGHYRKSGLYGRLMRPTAHELNFLDLDFAPPQMTAGMSAVSNTLFVIPQGDNVGERTARHIDVKKIQFRFDAKLASTINASNSAVKYRVVVYLDKQANGAAAGINDYFQDPTDINTFNNLENSHRFRTLYDKTYTIRASGVGYDGTDDIAHANIRQHSYYWKGNLRITYDSSATTGALTTIRSNNVGIMIGCDTGNAVTIVGKIRIRYVG